MAAFSIIFRPVRVPDHFQTNDLLFTNSLSGRVAVKKPCLSKRNRDFDPPCNIEYEINETDDC